MKSVGSAAHVNGLRDTVKATGDGSGHENHTSVQNSEFGMDADEDSVDVEDDDSVQASIRRTQKFLRNRIKERDNSGEVEEELMRIM